MDGIDNLIGFFDRIRSNRFKILRQIPSTTRHRRPQGRHNVDQPVNGARGLLKWLTGLRCAHIILSGKVGRSLVMGMGCVRHEASGVAGYPV